MPWQDTIGTNGMPTAPVPYLQATTDRHYPAAATAAVVTYAAGGAAVSHTIEGVAWSYSAAPTGGRLSITDGGTVIFDIDIIAGGPGQITFSRPLKATANAALVVTLASGAGAVVGKLNVLGKGTA